MIVYKLRVFQNNLIFVLFNIFNCFFLQFSVISVPFLSFVSQLFNYQEITVFIINIKMQLTINFLYYNLLH